MNGSQETKKDMIKRKVLILGSDMQEAICMKSVLQRFDDRLDIHGPLLKCDEAVLELQSCTDYNVVFSSFRLADGDALEVFRKAHPLSLVMFTSLCDEHTMQEVRLLGENYVVCDGKPDSILRAMDQIWQASIRFLGTRMPPRSLSYRDRVLVEKKGAVHILLVSEISHFHVENRCLVVYDAQGERYFSREKISLLEDVLDPTLFIRANRQYIVCRDAIRRYYKLADSRLQVWLKHGSEEPIFVSKTHSKMFAEWAGSDKGQSLCAEEIPSDKIIE